MFKLGLFTKLIVVCALGWSLMMALPNVLPESARAKLPDSFSQKTLNLGLDLQGGSHLVLQVDMQAVITRAYENLEDAIRRELRSEKVGYQFLKARNNQVTFTLRDPSEESTMRGALLRLGSIHYTVSPEQKVTVTYRDEEVDRIRTTALRQTVEVLRARVDEFGVAEPVIQQQGDDRVIVQLPGVGDVERAKASIGKTAQLTFHLVDTSADASNPFNLPPNRTILPSKDGGTIVVHKRPALTGSMLTNASSGFDQYNQPSVDIAFDSRGTRIFGKLSTDHVNQQFAIVLDNQVLSAPVFREPILGGRAQITGNFQIQESQDLATLLNAGGTTSTRTCGGRAYNWPVFRGG